VQLTFSFGCVNSASVEVVLFIYSFAYHPDFVLVLVLLHVHDRALITKGMRISVALQVDLLLFDVEGENGAHKA